MKKSFLALPLLLAAQGLSAGDLDLYLLANSALSPKANTFQGTLDPATGLRLGKDVSLAGDLRHVGVGAATTLLSPGNWRVKVGAEYTMATSNTEMNLDYLRFQGLNEYSISTQGAIKSTSINPAVSLVYVSSGAGEYGVSYEQHLISMTYDITKVVGFNGATAIASGARSLKGNFSDPFVAFHATFVQRYRTAGFFARISVGMNLATVKGLGDLTESDFLTLNKNVLDLARPKQEIKLALGTRF